ncbi:MAG TPA: ABC transporter substrate-binding protein [Chloroflexota bacterium]|jgi:peptide/nickel transport system substrate-binding protein
MRFQYARTAGTVATAATLLTSCLVLRPAQPARADSTTLLVAADIQDGRTMDPGRSYEFTASAMQSNCYDTLITYKGNDTIHPVPDLAVSLPTVSGGKVYTFHLRQNVRFASGNPMTAADVVFSYRRLLYLNDNPGFLIAGATDIKALNTYTVQISLSAPDVSFLSALADVNFAVLDSKVVIAHGGDDSVNAAKLDKATTFLDGQSAGTGAFTMTNWTRNNQIVMERNPNYWGPKPFFSKIIFQNQVDSAQQRLLVQRGAVDAAMNINLQQVTPLLHDSSVKVVTGNTLDLIYMGMTLNPAVSKPLSDARVRQAIRYALDYDGILKGLLKGVGTRPNGMIPVGMVGNDTATNNSLLIHQDLAKARSLLTAAGYANGFTVNMNYDVNTTFDSVTFDPLAAKVQNDLARVGIKVNLVPQQDTILLPAYRAQKLQMVLYNWGVDYPDPNDYAGPFSPGGGPAKRMWYVPSTDTGLMNIVARADTTTDLAKRTALYRTVQQTWLKESPFIGVVQPQNILVFGSNIKGYVYSPILPKNFRTLSK